MPNYFYSVTYLQKKKTESVMILDILLTFSCIILTYIPTCVSVGTACNNSKYSTGNLPICTIFPNIIINMIEMYEIYILIMYIICIHIQYIHNLLYLMAICKLHHQKSLDCNYPWFICV